MLCSYGFLPKIIQPTRVTEHTSSLIDNIFSNNIIDETKSGTILLTLECGQKCVTFKNDQFGPIFLKICRKSVYSKLSE